MNNSYGYNLVTSIGGVRRKNKPEIQLKKWTSVQWGTVYALVRGPFWWPYIKNSCGLNHVDDHIDWPGHKITKDNRVADLYEEFLDLHEQHDSVKKYLSETTILKYFESQREVKIIELDRLSNFKEFFEKNTSRLLALLCGYSEKILFSAIISHRGFVGSASQKSLMLSNIRMFGKNMVLADHIWVAYSKRWSAAEPLIGGKKVHVLGKVVQYKRKDGSVDYSIKATKVIRA
jgi:hypothetical protein